MTATFVVAAASFSLEQPAAAQDASRNHVVGELNRLGAENVALTRQNTELATGNAALRAGNTKQKAETACKKEKLARYDAGGYGEGESAYNDFVRDASKCSSSSLSLK